MTATATLSRPSKGTLSSKPKPVQAKELAKWLRAIRGKLAELGILSEIDGPVGTALDNPPTPESSWDAINQAHEAKAFLLKITTNPEALNRFRAKKGLSVADVVTTEFYEGIAFVTEFMVNYGGRVNELQSSQRKLLNEQMPKNLSSAGLAKYHKELDPAIAYFEANPVPKAAKVQPAKPAPPRYKHRRLTASFGDLAASQAGTTLASTSRPKGQRRTKQRTVPKHGRNGFGADFGLTPEKIAQLQANMEAKKVTFGDPNFQVNKPSPHGAPVAGKKKQKK